MSRVRVLNLPPTVTDTELHKFFVHSPSAARLAAGETGATKGKKVDLSLTDTFIVRHKTKNVVRMAFLGFKTTAAANAVIEHFDGSFMGSNKLKLEAAMGVDDALKHKKQREERSDLRWQREKERQAKIDAQKEGKTSENGRQKRGREAEEGKEGGDNTQLDHFLQDQTEKGPTFTSELLLPVGNDQSKQQKSETREEEEQEQDDAEEQALKKQQALEGVSDLDFLGGLVSEGSKPAGAEGDDVPEGTGPAEGDSSDLALVKETRRIHIKNLPFSATENDVKNLLSGTVGSIDSIHLPLTRDTKQSKGFAFVQFVSIDDAVNALSLHMTGFLGRLIRVTAASAAPQPAGGEGAAGAGEGGDSNQPKHKEARAAKREAEIAGKSSGVNWNPLYMASSSAVSTMAKRMDVSEKDLVSKNAAGAAVTTAIAEAVLTTEAKRILGEDGIDLEKVNSNSNALHKNRSNTTILAKNLGHEFPITKLLDMFKACGPLDTVATPVDPTFLLVSFIHPQDARTAFHRLAYKKLGGTPLFLEWAPVGCIKDDADLEDAELGLDETDKMIAEKRLRKAASGVTEEEDDDSNTKAAISTFTAYLTNIPFNADEEALRVFIQDTAPRVARPGVLQRIDYHPENGRAFVTVNDEPSLKYIVAKLQGKTLNGRTLACQVSDSTTAAQRVPATATPEPVAEENDTPRVPPGCDPMKLIVKNLPFEATEKELRELFKSFTEVKAVRVPRKVHQTQSHRDNNHRGFGFVEFLTAQEAANAVRALSNTHLYGRHLVIQYASVTNTGA